MENRYARNLGALTAQECQILRKKRVCVVGCGGLGGYVVEELARIGVGALTLIDGDVFDESNLNRQLLCTERSLGKSKAEAAAERVAAINSDVQSSAVQAFLTAENAMVLLRAHDLAIDALDGIPARRILAKACTQLGIPLIHGAIGGWNAQIAVILPGSGALDTLYPPDACAPSLGNPSFTPALAASIQVAEAVKLLVGRESALAGKLLLIDLMQQSYDLIGLP